MSYSQPYQPRPQRPDRTPSTNNVIPYPPGAPAVQQPRFPFSSPESPRPGSSVSQRSYSRPGPAPHQYPPRSGTASPQQPFRPGTASSSRSHTYASPASPHPPRPDYQRSVTSPRSSDYRSSDYRSSDYRTSDYRPVPSSSPAPRSPQPPFSPGYGYQDGTRSPLSQATTQVELHDVSLAPGPGPSAPTPTTNHQPDRPPTIPPPPAGVPAPTTHSRFSDASQANAAAARNFKTDSRGGLGPAPDANSWPRLAQWTVLPLIVIISAAEAIVMGHSLSLYGGLKVGGTVDNTVSTHPVWPSDLSLLPTWLLLAVGFTSFCASIVVWGLSLRARLMKPVKRLAGWRVGLGIFFVGAWIAALAVYKLFEAGAGGQSLSGWACEHQGDGVTGKEEIAAVCTEQNAGFALSIVSAILELALIGCFAVRTMMAKKDSPLSEKL
ncbi:hypothetical protein DIS24_g9326 [Lasiodiplodia hormozganensis]|uniref:Uncharacterized protein n=1 Tax=Lasiodiplodia hormozganensis TaxID=869390 RepID=A0AA39XUR2_9PEZI|nr:hypothetical protein DIS24_g9326 [Lasiodiplodia hormozganensis]